MGLTAAIAGFVVNGWHTKGWGGVYVKLSIVCVLTFLLCTVAINTTAFWLLYAPTTNYWVYLTTRLFLKGQILNTLLNSVALFVFTPLLSRIKPLKIHL
jgi:membrane associated rhomboid family serine protease